MVTILQVSVKRHLREIIISHRAFCCDPAFAENEVSHFSARERYVCTNSPHRGGEIF